MADQTVKQLTAYNALIAGFNAALPGGGTTFLLRNKLYTKPDLLVLLSGIQVTLAAVPAAALAHKAAVKARLDIEAEAVSLLTDVTAALKGGVGSSNTTGLAPYGVSVHKTPTPLTSEQKVARTQKALATRKARGTLGQEAKVPDPRDGNDDADAHGDAEGAVRPGERPPLSPAAACGGGARLAGSAPEISPSRSP